MGVSDTQLSQWKNHAKHAAKVEAALIRHGFLDDEYTEGEQRGRSKEVGCSEGELALPYPAVILATINPN